jgi:hypothetical protein
MGLVACESRASKTSGDAPLTDRSDRGPDHPGSRIVGALGNLGLTRLLILGVTGLTLLGCFASWKMRAVESL